MSRPTFSVIMPAYNAAQFIGKAIDSVLLQTRSDWELIVVDDGSTDDTATVISTYSDSRITCIHQENRGLPAARNAAICRANGRYLGFLDSDDEWMPSFLERCSDALEATDLENVVGVYTSHVYIDGQGQTLPQRGNDIVPIGALYPKLLRSGFFPPCVVLVQTRVVRELGGFDSSLAGTGSEDMDLWLRIARRYAMLGLAEPLARYRVHGANMSGNPDGMHANRMAVVAKQFGAAEGDPHEWPQDKRIAYAYRFRASAQECIAADQEDRGWDLLAQGVCILPDLAFEHETYVSMISAHKPRGYRGTAAADDLLPRAVATLERVRWLCLKAHLSDLRLAEAATLRAYALLSDISGDWSTGRRYQWQATVRDRAMWRDRQAVRRMCKFMLGTRVGRYVRLNASSDQGAKDL